MNVEAGNKRSRHCVSPPPPQDDSHTTAASAPPSNLVWQQWTASFRATRRLQNDLLADDGIDSAVERHMSLTKKRSLLDDDSDSDDEGNYYKLDEPPIEQQQQPVRQHPLEFTPSGFFPAATRLGPQQVTPVSCDPDALPVCTLRRYGHGDDEDDDRIPPPPPSFLRYPSSKKRAVGVARPQPEQDLYTRTGSTCIAPPQFTRGVSSLAVEREGLKLGKACEAAAAQRLPGWSLAAVPPPPAAMTRNASKETTTKLDSENKTCSAASSVAAP